MAVINYVHFDVHEYIKKAISFGTKEELAEYQARTIEQITEHQTRVVQDLSETVQEQQTKIIALEAREPATKTDVARVEQELKNTELRLLKEIEVVRREISDSKNQTLLWMFGMLTGFAVFFLSVLAKGFHWL